MSCLYVIYIYISTAEDWYIYIEKERDVDRIRVLQEDKRRENAGKVLDFRMRVYKWTYWIIGGYQNHAPRLLLINISIYSQQIKKINKKNNVYIFMTKKWRGRVGCGFCVFCRLEINGNCTRFYICHIG